LIDHSGCSYKPRLPYPILNVWTPHYSMNSLAGTVHLVLVSVVVCQSLYQVTVGIVYKLCINVKCFELNSNLH